MLPNSETIVAFKDVLLIDGMSDYMCGRKILSGESTDFVKDGYNFVFFKISDRLHRSIKDKLTLEIQVNDDFGSLILNGYMNERQFDLRRGPCRVEIPKAILEVGENALAYKGRCIVENLIYEEESSQKVPSLSPTQVFQKHSLSRIEAAATFLCTSVIDKPDRSPFRGSCYCIYDYDNECYRMPCWLWSDAPAVSALLGLADRTTEEKQKIRYRDIALNIGEALLRNQVIDRRNENFGALVSRHEYYTNKSRSFDCLLGPNDASFIVKWAFLPLYRHTGNEVFRERSEHALAWVRKTIYEFGFVPSHYYSNEERWEESAFVDTGFTPEGFCEYNKTFAENRDLAYAESVDFFMERFVEQFRMENGFYGQNYRPDRGVTSTIFTRGQGWVLEGLISAFEETKAEWYKEEAINLARLLIENQNRDGSWAFFLGNGHPEDEVKQRTGICEKATTLFAYLLLRLAGICEIEDFLFAADSALEWCENNMVLEQGPGYGGIASRSLGSGITGLPYLRVATGYANAFYVMGSLLREESL